MLIYQGRGAFVPLIALLSFFAALLLLSAFELDLPNELSWLSLINVPLSGVAIFLFARKCCPTGGRLLLNPETLEEEEVDLPSHSFFFIPVRFWAVLAPLFFGLLAYIGFTGDGFGSTNFSAPSQRWSAKIFDRAFTEQPESTPAVFAPGRISDGMDQRDTAISFDQEHFLYTLQFGRQARIMHVHERSWEWRKPETASFSGTWRDLEPAFQPGTLQLYFCSNRPLPGEETAGDFNLWKTSWTGDDWSEPVPLPFATPPAAVNTDGDEFYPSLTSSGDLFYTSKQSGGAGGEDIWFAAAQGDYFATPTPLGPGVNTAADEFNAAIHPSGNHLLFGSVRADGPGGGDLYLSSRTPNGEWGPAHCLPSPINSESLDFCPLFFGEPGEIWFTSRRPGDAKNLQPADSLKTLRERWESPGNGYGDLYRAKIDLSAD